MASANKSACGEGDAEGQHERIQLGQEQCGKRGGDRETPAAQEGRATKHDGRYRREQVRVALVCGRLVEDSREQAAREPVEDHGPDVRARAVALHAQSRRPGRDGVRTDGLEPPARHRLLDRDGDDGGGGHGEEHRIRYAEGQTRGNRRQ
jgi:hypothetical protein